MSVKPLMILGTGSNVGKTTLVAGLGLFKNPVFTRTLMNDLRAKKKIPLEKQVDQLGKTIEIHCNMELLNKKIKK